VFPVRTVIIIQARMGSRRLPKKTMMDLCGKPLVQQVYDRARKVSTVDEVVVATTVDRSDDEIEAFCRAEHIPVFRGSEEDVLDRYYRAAARYDAEAVVRITGDCPLLDPLEIERVLLAFSSGEFDYASNTRPPRLPDGLDAAIVTRDALKRSWQGARLRSEREHVTQYIRNRPDAFRILDVGFDEDCSAYRWTIDREEDYEFIRKVYDELAKRGQFGHLPEVLRILEDKPELLEINTRLQRDEGLNTSLEEDDKIILNSDFTRSNSLLERAKRSMPVAASTYSKSYRYFCEGAMPAFLNRGDGGHVWDVDENEYIDYVVALGPISVGYNDPRINQAVRDQLEKGMSFSLTTEIELQLSEKLIDLIPCAEMVKFVKNGSDATGAAVRLARAFTDRDMVLCCGYHGWQEWYVGSTQNNLGVPNSVRELTRSFPYNDLPALGQLLSLYKDRVAAVILEPMGLVPPDDGYLNAVKQMTHENGALLIFDEVVSGFRLGLTGGQGYFGVTPDLAAYGKAMGNGAAISAVVGRKDVMSLIEKGAFISTTFGGETLAIAAALKTIQILEQEDPFAHFTHLGQLLLDGMTTIVEDYDLTDTVSFEGLPYHPAVRFKNTGSLETNDLLSVFQQEAARRGVLMLIVHNFCLAHTEADIRLTLEAYRHSFGVVKEALTYDSVDGILRGGKFSPIFARRSNA
jgi:glutamate-1-semialdehyde 2,1-aminomutase/spore coat polysaccharide biosynthesis protein SpsF